MASSRHVSDSESDGDEDDLEVDLVRTPEPQLRPDEQNEEEQSPQSVLSHRFRSSPARVPEPANRSGGSVAVLIPAPERPWEYEPFQGDTTVDTVLEDIEGSNGVHRYRIEYEDGNQEEVSPFGFSLLPVAQSCVLPSCMTERERNMVYLLLCQRHLGSEHNEAFSSYGSGMQVLPGVELAGIQPLSSNVHVLRLE